MQLREKSKNINCAFFSDFWEFLVSPEVNKSAEPLSRSFLTPMKKSNKTGFSGTFHFVRENK